MKTNITIEQLAEKMGKQIWSKGDLKRIYLNDAGYNTKKMSTKTWIYQDANGNFKVSCKIECPSQAWQWIESQEQEVKESVYRDIDNALKLMELTFISYTINKNCNNEITVYVKRGENEPEYMLFPTAKIINFESNSQLKIR